MRIPVQQCGLDQSADEKYVNFSVGLGLHNSLSEGVVSALSFTGLGGYHKLLVSALSFTGLEGQHKLLYRRRPQTKVP